MDENITRGYYQPHSSESMEMTSQPLNGRDHTRQSKSSRGPRDHCSCMYLAFVLCGAGFLLPYNCFITAVDYYQTKFPDSTIIFDMSLTYIVMAFIGVIINNLLVEVFSLHTRISFGYLASFTTLLVITLCDVTYELFSTSVSYKVTLVAIAFIALGCTVQQSSFYGYTSMLPARYTQAVMTGESAAGLAVSINRILTKAMLHDVKQNTVIFFSICIATVAMCFVVFCMTRCSSFVRYHVTTCRRAGIADDQRGIVYSQNNPEEVDILDGNASRDHYGVLVLESPTATNPAPANRPSSSADRDKDDTMEQFARQNELQIKTQGYAYRRHLTSWDAVRLGVQSRWRVARIVWPYMVSIGLAYFVTLCLFPGIESEVRSCQLGTWMPVILIATFNLTDFIGKIVASIPYDWLRMRLVLCTAARIVLVPLLMLCASPRQHPVVSGDVWPILLSAALGVTNGYLGSVPMIMAPGKVPDHQKELSGNIMTMSYSLGLTLGSAVAYLLDSWLGPHLAYDPCTAVNQTLTMAFLNSSVLETKYDIFLPH